MNITNNVLNAKKRDPYLHSAKLIYLNMLEEPRPDIWLTVTDYFQTFKIQSHIGSHSKEELAYFSIRGKYHRAPFELKTAEPPSMNIDCSDYRGQRVSKMLMLVVFHFAKLEYKRFNEDSELYIDTDASDLVDEDKGITYWTAIGMKENTCSSDHASFGYEKQCRLKDLKPYLFRLHFGTIELPHQNGENTADHESISGGFKSLSECVVKDDRS
jgi:hypothetical protein